MDPRSNLTDPTMTLSLIPVLVRRCGGQVEITQSDLDAIAYNSLEECAIEDGSVRFTVIDRQRNS